VENSKFFAAIEFIMAGIKVMFEGLYDELISQQGGHHET
jgi:hypothetical protein